MTSSHILSYFLSLALYLLPVAGLIIFACLLVKKYYRRSKPLGRALIITIIVIFMVPVFFSAGLSIDSASRIIKIIGNETVGKSIRIEEIAVEEYGYRGNFEGYLVTLKTNDSAVKFNNTFSDNELKKIENCRGTDSVIVYYEFSDGIYLESISSE